MINKFIVGERVLVIEGDFTGNQGIVLRTFDVSGVKYYDVSFGSHHGSIKTSSQLTKIKEDDKKRTRYKIELKDQYRFPHWEISYQVSDEWEKVNSIPCALSPTDQELSNSKYQAIVWCQTHPYVEEYLEELRIEQEKKNSIRETIYFPDILGI